MQTAKYNPWSKRDPIKNCFLLPNELFNLGLEAGEIAVYSYLLRCEDRKTHQCWPSYQTIGSAVGMSKKTVRKYVAMLEDKRLIATEQTTVRSQNGRKQNGSLLYTILPIQEAQEHFHARQMAELERTTAIHNAKAKAEKLGVQFIPSNSEQTA